MTSKKATKKVARKAAKKATSKKATTKKKAVKSCGNRSVPVKKNSNSKLIKENDVEILKRLKEVKKFINNERNECHIELIKLGRPQFMEYRCLKDRRIYLNRKFIVLCEQVALLNHIIFDFDEFSYDSRHAGHDPFRHTDGYMFGNDY